VVLAPAAADAIHPAFSNLFVQTEIIRERRAILCTRRPRSIEEKAAWMFHLYQRIARMISLNNLAWPRSIRRATPERAAFLTSWDSPERASLVALVECVAARSLTFAARILRPEPGAGRWLDFRSDGSILIAYDFARTRRSL
jgi:hypothetical protein